MAEGNGSGIAGALEKEFNTARAKDTTPEIDRSASLLLESARLFGSAYPQKRIKASADLKKGSLTLEVTGDAIPEKGKGGEVKLDTESRRQEIGQDRKTEDAEALRRKQEEDARKAEAPKPASSTTPTK